MSEKYCFLDMDGVLADFVGGICQVHNRPSPYEDPRAYNEFDIEKLWGMTPEEFWVPVAKPGFWIGLKKTDEADDIVDLACKYFGPKNVAILTAPANDPGCVPEKKEWIAKYYPQLKANILYGSAKRFLAGPDRLLIDDRDKNVANFRDAGGSAILLPRLWNADYDKAADPLYWLLRRLYDPRSSNNREPDSAAGNG